MQLIHAFSFPPRCKPRLFIDIFRDNKDLLERVQLCSRVDNRIFGDPGAIQTGIDWSLLPIYLVGTAIAAVVGYFAIRLVNLLTDKGKFGNFAYYCWGVGVLALILSILL